MRSDSATSEKTIDISLFKEYIERRSRYEHVSSIADQLGVTKGRLYNILNGQQKRIGVGTLDRYAIRLGKSLWEFDPEQQPDWTNQ